MDYFTRNTINSLVDNERYSAVKRNNAMMQMAATAAVGTAYSVDGQTGRVLSAIADGSERFNSITNSSLLGNTTPSYSKGNSGNGGFGDGR